MTRSGQPGRTLMVGCTLRCRSISRCPARLVVACVDCCSALTRSLSEEPKTSSLPTPSTVAMAMPLRSFQVWKSLAALVGAQAHVVRDEPVGIDDQRPALALAHVAAQG